MSKKYFLPCNCGKQISVEKAQAGQGVTCESCGGQLEVPTLRGLRELEPVDDEDTDSHSDQDWNISQGYLFTVGLVLMVLGLAVSITVYRWRTDMKRASTKPVIRELEAFDQDIDSKNVVETWDFWQKVIETKADERDGLGHWEPHNYLYARKEVGTWTVVLSVALGFALIGLIAVVASFAMKSPKLRPGPPKG